MSNLKVTIGYHNNKPFINIYKDKIRYRYWNGKAINLKIKAKENPTLLKAAFELAGTRFIGSRCFAMGQRKKQPKETTIALQSKFLFSSQEDASIT